MQVLVSRVSMLTRGIRLRRRRPRHRRYAMAFESPARAVLAFLRPKQKCPQCGHFVFWRKREVESSLETIVK